MPKAAWKWENIITLHIITLSIFKDIFIDHKFNSLDVNDERYEYYNKF